MNSATKVVSVGLGGTAAKQGEERGPQCRGCPRKKL